MGVPPSAATTPVAGCGMCGEAGGLRQTVRVDQRALRSLRPLWAYTPSGPRGGENPGDGGGYGAGTVGETTARTPTRSQGGKPKEPHGWLGTLAFTHHRLLHTLSHAPRSRDSRTVRYVLIVRRVTRHDQVATGNVELGGTFYESPDLPGGETQRGKEHGRKAAKHEDM